MLSRQTTQKKGQPNTIKEKIIYSNYLLRQGDLQRISFLALSLLQVYLRSDSKGIPSSETIFKALMTGARLGSLLNILFKAVL